MNTVSIDTSQMKRAQLVPMLTAAAVKIAMKIGVPEQLNSELGTHLTANFVGFTVAYRAPKAMIFSAHSAFGIDVWHGGKCFSVAWNSQKLKDYQVINFKRGPWIPALLLYSEQLDD